MSRKSVLAISALALSLALAGSIQHALAQDTYGYDNFQNAPPGSFLNNKVKPQTTPAKTAARAPVKGKTQAKPAAKPVAPQSGVYNSGQMVPGNSFNYPAQNQLGQSDFIQPSGSGGGGQDQPSTSGWVTPDTLGNQVDNSYPQPQTQTPFDGDVELQQEFANQNNGGGLSTSGWVNPGGSNNNGNFSQPTGNQGGGLSTSGWVNPGGSNNNGNFSQPMGNQGGGLSTSGWVNPGNNMVSQPAPVQDNNVSSSGWITPGGGKGKGSSKPIKMAQPAQQPQFNSQPMPTQSQQWSQPQANTQANNQAPLFGQVLQQEQGAASGNFQGTGATAGANGGNMSAANPPDMPAGGFTVSPDAAVMPGMMNMLMNMQKQNGGVAATGQRRAAPQRGFSSPPMVRGVSNQVGRTVNRAVNRSVNQMLYKGLNSLRF